jgi:hypothetical protein
MKFVIVAVTLLSLTALFGPNSAQAEISVSQNLSKTDIAFEDTTVFEIVLQWDGPQTAYRFDKPLNPLIDLMRVKGYSSSISSTGTGAAETTTKRYKYVLVPTQSGTGRIAPVDVAYLVWPDSIPGQLTTEPMSVQIAKPVPKPEKRESFPWVYIVIAVIVLGGVVVAVVILRKRPKADTTPSRKPEESVLDGLARLKADAGGDFKKFQSGLHSLLTSYLKEKYQFETAQLDARTIESSLLETKLSESQQKSLAEWIINAERDKFRPVSPEPGEIMRLETEIRTFFQQVK